MANYKDIKGTAVSIVSSNPSTITEGSVWYNTTDEALRVGRTTAAGAWSSAPNLVQPANSSAGDGPADAAIIYSGDIYAYYASYPENPSSKPGLHTQTYDGTSWTLGPNMNDSARYRGSTSHGSQTATLAFGGDAVPPSPGAPVYLTNSEQYNGSSWTATPSMPVGRSQHGSFGTVTSAVAFAGRDANVPTTYQSDPVLYNGSSWTSIPNTSINPTSYPQSSEPHYEYAKGTGPTSAALAIFAVHPSNDMPGTMSYNGSTWTTEAVKNVGSYGADLAGTSTIAVWSGAPVGSTYPLYTPSFQNITEIWNGSSWTTGNGASTNHYYGTTTGSGSTTYLMGGEPAGITTEVFTTPGTAAFDVPGTYVG
jgi:hypothetical protein